MLNGSLKFPDGFLWGTATAAHQIEGNNRNNDWWEWEHNHEIDKSGEACNSFNLCDEDIKLIKELNNNAYRFSIEWSRIEPQQGVFDQKAIEHYKVFLQKLRNNKINTFVTLHHFTSPIWFAKIGGFEKSKNIELFLEFVEVCAKEFSDLVDFWITFNEPNMLVAQSHFHTLWPPGKKSLLQGIISYRNLATAHRKSYEIIHKYSSSPVGTAMNTGMIYCSTNNPLDQKMVSIARWLWNESFHFLAGDKIDFLGVNYYFSSSASITDLPKYLKHRRSTNFIHLSDGNKFGRTDVDWPIYPRGLYDVLTYLKQRGIPIYITENGLADAKDEKRSEFIKEHLIQLHKALADGLDVKGYMHWTLMDNFEWMSGFEAKFGLFETNFKTFKRTPRPSAKLYAKIAESNSLDL